MEYWNWDATDFICETGLLRSRYSEIIHGNACFMRVRLTTTAAPSTINCYLLQTETTNGFVNLESLTSMVKLQATTDTLSVTVSETRGLVGVPFKVQRWERGDLSTTTGAETASTTYLRSVGYIDVAPGEKYISQMRDGTAVTMAFFIMMLPRSLSHIPLHLPR